jgi:hypothetical protein
MFSHTRTRSPTQISKAQAIAVGHTVPVGDVLVGDARGHIEHDDAALPVDVVSVSQAAELLLSSRIPDIEGDWSEVLCLG